MIGNDEDQQEQEPITLEVHDSVLGQSANTEPDTEES